LKKIVALALFCLLVAGCSQAAEPGNLDATKPLSQEQEEVVGNAEDDPEVTDDANPRPKVDFSSKAADPESCKIMENSNIYPAGTPVFDYTGRDEIKGDYKGNPAAFPFRPTVLPTSGELLVIMLKSEWADLPGTDDDSEYYERNARTLEDFWSMATEGKLKVTVEIVDRWFTLAGSYLDFQLTPEDEAQRADTRPKKQALWDAIVDASDELVDFTKVDVVLPAFPRGATVSREGPHDFNFDWNAAMYTEEGAIYDIAAAGDGFINFGDVWFYYAHEMGHMLGIQHMGADYLGAIEAEYRAPWIVNGMAGFDVMGNQDGAIKTLSSWHRWLAGWLDDSQVRCLQSTQIEEEYFELFPINEIGAPLEALVINLDETMNVVVESRRWDARFDRNIVHSRDGIIVYTVDAMLGPAQSNMKLISPRDITKILDVQGKFHREELDGNLCQGDTVRIADLVIEATWVGDATDVVKVSRSDSWIDPRQDMLAKGEFNQISNGCVFGELEDLFYLEKVDPEWLDTKRGLRSSYWSEMGYIPLPESRASSGKENESDESSSQG